MIKQLCAVSAVQLNQAGGAFQTALPALRAVRKGAPLLGEHWIFALPAAEVVLLASHTPPEQLSRTERHLLFLAMARATGCIQQDWPCTLACTGTAEEAERAALWDTAILKAWDGVAALLRSIVANHSAWKKALGAASTADGEDWEAAGGLPRLRLGKQQHPQQLPGFLIGVLVPIATAYLDAVAAGRGVLTALSRATAGEGTSKLEDEILYERELKRALAVYGTRRATGLLTYTPTIGRKVLELLRQEFPAVLAAAGAARAEWQDILCLPAEKVASKYPTSTFRTIQELVASIPAGLGAEDTVVRSYKLLTIRHLDTLISYEYTLGEMFGGATTRAVSKYSKEAGVQWEVRGLSDDPMQQAMALAAMQPAVAPKAPDSQNPLALRLRAKREAALAMAAAGSTVAGSTVAGEGTV